MDINNIEQLKKLSKVFNTDNVITSAEIEQVLAGILTIMSSFKKDNENLTKEATQVVNDLLDKVISESDNLKKETSITLDSQSKKIMSDVEDKLLEVKRLIKEAKATKPKNGKDANEPRIIKSVLDQIKLPEYKPTLLDTPKEIKDKLETLNGDDRLDISAIKGIDKLATQANLERGISILDQRTQFLINKTSTSGTSSPLTTKGDVYTYSTTNDRLPVGANGTVLTADSSTATGLKWAAVTGTGTVTDVSVTSANGFAGSVATSTTTPAITISTTVTGLLKGNGTAVSAAVANTDYQSPITLTTTGTSGAATFNGTTLNIPNYTSGDGTPGGSDTQLQYNDAGAFGGITGATTNGTVVTLTSPIIATSQTNSYATASTIAIFDGSKNLISATTATYPSLTELSYVKGVTSAIQTQLDAKGIGTVTSVSVTTANGISGSVANATTTPAITLTLGNITPTTIAIGTLNYSPSNALTTSQQSVNSYSQNIIQNTSTGATASSDYIVNNSLSTDTTFYGDFGMNSSGFTGASVFNQPSYVYLTSTSTDLAIGTTTAHGMHFVVNGGTTDAMSINSNGVVSAPNIVLGYTTTATAAGTTTLTVSSTRTQIFTGSTTQTVVLPTTNVLQGQQYNIINRSTGLVTVQSSGANTITILGANTSALFTANVATPTTAANWNSQYFGVNAASGKVATINNTITLAGTDAQTYTFPSATTTIGGLGTTQTWTGANTFNNANVLAGAATMAIFNTTATTITAFGAATTMTIGGTPTTAITHNYSTNATAAATTKTVNLGTGGAASSTTNINIGSANGGTTTVNSPTISLGGTTGATTTGTIELGAASDTTLARVAAGIISVEGEVMNGYATTATAAGTTTLTITSAKTQFFTGTSTQTVTLPTTSVIVGQAYRIVNNSTGNVTVQSSGANTIQILGAGMSAWFTALQATPTTAAHWSCALQSFTGQNIAQTASSNAATVNLAYVTNTITNNSAATLTITLPTAGAVDGEMRVVRVLDFSAVAQTLTWTNTENSTVTAPTTTNGSTTLPLTVGFQYNNATSKWRCIANA